MNTKTLQLTGLNVGLDKIANVDIYLPAYRIVIECDGCRYHSCKIHSPHTYTNTPEIDAMKIKMLNEAGYQVFRFWEHEINESPKLCLNKIKI